MSGGDGGRPVDSTGWARASWVQPLQGWCLVHHAGVRQRLCAQRWHHTTSLLRHPMNASAQLPRTQTTSVSPRAPCQHIVSTQSQSYAEFLGAWNTILQLLKHWQLNRKRNVKLQLWKPEPNSLLITQRQ